MGAIYGIKDRKNVKDLPEQIVKNNKDEWFLELLMKGLVYDEKNTNRGYGVSCRSEL